MPRGVPIGGTSRLYSKTEVEMEKLRRLFYEFTHQPDPRNRFADRLLAFYARLADKQAIPSPNLGGTYINFVVETPLTKEELRYAIETTLEFNNLAIIPVDKKSIRLGSVSELKSAQKNHNGAD